VKLEGRLREDPRLRERMVLHPRVGELMLEIARGGRRMRHGSANFGVPPIGEKLLAGIEQRTRGGRQIT